jgi:betaine-aldehyde dehydrogenase
METVTQNDFAMLLNGTMVSAQDKAVFFSLNPSTGEIDARLADASVNDMRHAIQSARQAFDHGVWSELSLKERGTYLMTIAQRIREHAKELADIESRDTGKTIKQSTFIDVPTAADTFEYFSTAFDVLKATLNPVCAPVQSLTQYEPVGVVGCIIPWNYPLITSAWKLAPALMAGNTVVLKPSPVACTAVMRLAQIIQEAGLPPGVVNIISSRHQEVAEVLVTHPQVDMISFTGSSSTGRAVMRAASSMTKKLILELGGKSPNIVFADCDMDAALGGTLSAIFMNQGQMCTAGSRLLLAQEIYDRFLERLIAKTKALKIGHASSYETDFGPLVSQGHRDQVLAMIQQAKKEGAALACGGCIPVLSDPQVAGGFYLEPAIFTEVNPSMSIVREEVFGPVLTVQSFKTTDEAISLANDTSYGLAASIWTKDLSKAHSISRRLRCGTVWINTYGGFYNEAPFGGCKHSGFGRELGAEGLKEYTQPKHICTDRTPGGMPLVASWF